MILDKQGQEFSADGIRYVIGMPVIGTDTSEYSGLYGHIMEIRTGADMETDNDGPDI